MTSPSRDFAHPATDRLVLTEVLFALSDPVRLAIVSELATDAGQELSCQAVGGDLPKSTRSHHLKTLREAGLIRNVPHGRERRVSLRAEDLEERFPGLLGSVLGAPGGDTPT
jgi:DNA-binding transcriptional ArsR family regulator